MCYSECRSGLDASAALVDAVTVVLTSSKPAAGVGFYCVAFNAFPWQGCEACMTVWGCAAFPDDN